MQVFSEIQKFDQWWFRLIFLAISLICVLSIYSTIGEIGIDNSMDFWMPLVVCIITLCILFSFAFLFKLYTRIDENGIHFGFWPFNTNLNLAKWSDLEKCFVRKYNPITEYGGWGYRATLFNKASAYNVKGNIGIQIVFNNGKKLLIGTQ